MNSSCEGFLIMYSSLLDTNSYPYPNSRPPLLLVLKKIDLLSLFDPPKPKVSLSLYRNLTFVLIKSGKSPIDL